MYELKPLSKSALPAALEKAERYRLLNEAAEAESICRDVLHIESENQQALVVLLLALTDQFDRGLPGVVHQAREILSRLQGEYERAYYAGIVCERLAKARLREGGPGSGTFAFGSLHEAMSWYEKAETLRPPGNDDALLRWNTCVRIIQSRQLGPAAEGGVEPPLE
jgi:hypothetical protein